jgi:phosphoglycolate phosphatase-like HAD superfamily hydrolase
MARFKHIIFDFDGVISDSFKAACEEINRIAQQHYPLLPAVHTHEDLVFMYSGLLKTSLHRFGLTDNEAHDFFNKHSSAMMQRSASIQVFYDVVRGIAEILPGRCSIVTSSYSNAVQGILRASNFYSEKMFTHIKGRELKQTKIEKITALLSDIKIPAHNALHVVDMVSDILYSREIPISCCAVGWGYHPVSYLSVFSPDFLVATPNELFDLLSRNI